jgi:hypothetical protein
LQKRGAARLHVPAVHDGRSGSKLSGCTPPWTNLDGAHDSVQVRRCSFSADDRVEYRRLALFCGRDATLGRCKPPHSHPDELQTAAASARERRTEGHVHVRGA